MNIPVTHYLFLSTALLTVGVIGVLTRRNLVIILMSIELILNAVNINLVAFSRQLADVNGQALPSSSSPTPLPKRPSASALSLLSSGTREPSWPTRWTC